jgi:hypothetical protein
MNNFLQEADAGCKTVFEDEKSDLSSSAIAQLAELQLAVIGGGVGNVLWG